VRCKAGHVPLARVNHQLYCFSCQVAAVCQSLPTIYCICKTYKAGTGYTLSFLDMPLIAAVLLWRVYYARRQSRTGEQDSAETIQNTTIQQDRV